MAPSLFADWDRVAAQIQSSRRVAVFLDFDGTLVNVERRPDQMHLAPSTRRVLRRLAHYPRVTLVIISGRRRAGLLRYIGLHGIRYFDLYGWERRRHSPLPVPTNNPVRVVKSCFDTEANNSNRALCAILPDTVTQEVARGITKCSPPLNWGPRERKSEQV